jgi:putative Ca2+/H+ antiporter (TMEM165/GDT1 family)
MIGFFLAARFKKPIPIILGILVATLLTHAVAGVLGLRITAALSPQWQRGLLGVSFIGMASWTLIPDEIEPDETHVGRCLVVLRTTLGMLIANVPAVFVGDKVATRIPMWWVHGLAAGVFAVLVC